MSDSCPQMKIVMKQLKQNRDIKQKLVIDFKSTHPDVSMLVNEMITSHIVNVPDLANSHLDIVSKYEPLILDWMRTISQRVVASELESSKKSRIALERKLNCAIANLLHCHNSKSREVTTMQDRSYAPLDNEITGRLTDTLRYNLVFDEKSYYSSVKSLLDFLIDEKGCMVSGKNFWRSKNEPSSYMGLNLVVKLPIDFAVSHLYADARFPFEIDCHTNDSFELQAGKSRDLLKIIKTERVVARRKQLNASLCDLWNRIHVPCDERFEPASFDEYVVDTREKGGKCLITKGMGDLLSE